MGGTKDEEYERQASLDPQDAPKWLADSLAWKAPHPVSRRGRKVGSRSTCRRVRGDGEQLEPVNNRVRDTALDALCKAMGLGGLRTKADLDAKIREIAARAGVTTTTLRKDIAKQVATELGGGGAAEYGTGRPDWAVPVFRIDTRKLKPTVDLIQAIVTRRAEWRDVAQSRERRELAERGRQEREAEWIALIPELERKLIK